MGASTSQQIILLGPKDCVSEGAQISQMPILVRDPGHPTPEHFENLKTQLSI